MWECSLPDPAVVWCRCLAEAIRSCRTLTSALAPPSVATTVAKVAVKAAEVAKVVVTKVVHPLLGHLVDHRVGRHLVGRHLVGYHRAEVVAQVVVGAGPHPKGRRAQQAAGACSQEGRAEATPAWGAFDGRERPEGATESYSSLPRAADALSSTGQPGVGRKGVVSGGAAATRARS